MACQSTSPDRSIVDSALTPQVVASAPDDRPDDLWERIRLDLSWQSVDRPRVDRAREQFLRQHNYVPASQDRSNYYLHHIVEEVDKRDMPIEIALLPMVESNLNPFAASRAGAAGLWQIMPRTGEHLGLTQDSGYDGRQALRDSTTGALNYLEALYKTFDNDWLLALAAYNCGPTSVRRAQRKNKAKGLDTDYWSLDLPLETENYIPKLLAITQIVANPRKFDVAIPAVNNAPSFEVVEVDKPLHLAKAAQLAGVDVVTLRALNPGRLQEAIYSQHTVELLLPVGTMEQFQANIAQASPAELMPWQRYQIQPGDNLGYIAQRFGTRVDVLQELNQITGTNIQTGATLKIPTHNGIFSKALLTEDYQVRRGDSLHLIAVKFNISVSDIVSWNALDPEVYLQPGQKLTVHATGG